MAAPKKEHPRKPVTYKLPPALLERIAEHAARNACTRTEVVERSLEAFLGPVGSTAVSRSPEPAQAPVERANAVPLDAAQARAAAFRAAASR